MLQKNELVIWSVMTHTGLPTVDMELHNIIALALSVVKYFSAVEVTAALGT